MQKTLQEAVKLLQKTNSEGGKFDTPECRKAFETIAITYGDDSASDEEQRLCATIFIESISLYIHSILNGQASSFKEYSKAYGEDIYAEAVKELLEHFSEYRASAGAITTFAMPHIKHAASEYISSETPYSAHHNKIRRTTEAVRQQLANERGVEPDKITLEDISNHTDYSLRQILKGDKMAREAEQGYKVALTDDVQIQDFGRSPEEAVIDKEMSDSLAWTISTLSEIEQRVLIEHAVNGVKYSHVFDNIPEHLIIEAGISPTKQIAEQLFNQALSQMVVKTKNSTLFFNKIEKDTNSHRLVFPSGEAVLEEFLMATKIIA